MSDGRPRVPGHHGPLRGREAVHVADAGNEPRGNRGYSDGGGFRGAGDVSRLDWAGSSRRCFRVQRRNQHERDSGPAPCARCFESVTSRGCGRCGWNALIDADLRAHPGWCSAASLRRRRRARRRGGAPRVGNRRGGRQRRKLLQRPTKRELFGGRAAWQRGVASSGQRQRWGARPRKRDANQSWERRAPRDAAAAAAAARDVVSAKRGCRHTRHAERRRIGISLPPPRLLACSRRSAVQTRRPRACRAR